MIVWPVIWQKSRYLFSFFTAWECSQWLPLFDTSLHHRKATSTLGSPFGNKKYLPLKWCALCDYDNKILDWFVASDKLSGGFLNISPLSLKWFGCTNFEAYWSICICSYPQWQDRNSIAASIMFHWNFFLAGPNCQIIQVMLYALYKS